MTLNTDFLDQFSALFFDLDGTLLQGSDDHYEQCVRKVGEQFGIPNITVTRGMSLRKFLHHNFPERCLSHKKEDENFEENFIEAYRKMIPQIPRNASFFPDAEKILEYTQHKKRVLVTNCSKHELTATRKFLDIDSYFPEIIFSNGIIPSKPSPDMYLKAAEISQVSPKNCLVFEDSLAGISAGKSAGMTVIALDRHHDLGENSGADYIISDFSTFF